MATRENSVFYSYNFTGRVHPERASIWMDKRAARVKLSFCAWEGEVIISISSGQISIIFTGTSEIEDIPTLKNTSQSFVQSFVDAIGYSLGRACVVEITTLTTSDGQTVFFDDADPSLPNVIHRPALPMPYLLTITGNNLWLRRALGELRESIAQPDDTAFHCYRAIESVRRHFQVGKNEAKGWRRLREALNVSEETIRTLKEFGDGQRHGDITPMTYAERARDMQISWRVVDRFTILLQEELHSLDSVKFPLI